MKYIYILCILVIVTIIGIIIALLSVKIAFSNDSLCDVEILQEIVIPNSILKIVCYNLDCGATTAKSYNVTIMTETSKLKKERGNIFSTHYESTQHFIVNYKNKKIVIRGKQSEIYIKLYKFGEFSIEYE